MGVPLKDRPAFRAEPDLELAYAVMELRKQHGLAGVIVISFYADRVGVDTSGQDADTSDLMRGLGMALVEAIDDGKFDPATIMAN